MNAHPCSGRKPRETFIALTAAVSLLVLAVFPWQAQADIVITLNTNAVDLANAVTASGGVGINVTASRLISHTDTLMGTTNLVSSGLYTLSGPLPDTYGLTLPGIVLSTGHVGDYQTGPNNEPGKTTGFDNGNGVPATMEQELLLTPISGGFSNHFDATQLDIVFNVQSGFSNIFFRVVFGSEEFPEFVGSPFVDAFGLYLNGSNIAFAANAPLPGTAPVNINHTNMMAIAGTELDGVLAPLGNPVMTFSAPVTPGSTSNVLTFIVADTSDPILDTTVYISSLGGTPPGECVPPPSGLVSWWPGDGNANDIIGDNPGEAQPTVTFPDGVVGPAFGFDGVGAFVHVPDSDSLDITNAITIDAWIKPLTEGNSDGTTFVMLKGDNTVRTTQSYGLVWAGQSIFFRLGSTDDIDQLSADIPLDIFTHVAGVYDGETISVYTNGVLAASKPSSLGALQNTGAPLIIGSSLRSGSLTDFFHGVVDEIEIFNRALCADEIRAIFAAGSAGKCTNVAPAAVACSLAPPTATNIVGATHTVIATLVADSDPVGGVALEFEVVSGPNSGRSGSDTTDCDGQASFQYTSNGSTGTDMIRATGLVGSQSLTCTATKVWISADVPPTIDCPANIITNNAAGQCSRSVAFAPVATGTPTPTVTCRTNSTVVTSPVTFPVGTTTVSCTASNSAGMMTCMFNVTVNDTQPPGITCPANVVRSTDLDECSAVVTYSAPTVSDNCPGAGAPNCNPASGSAFPKGTTTVNCTASDASANTATCSFTVTVNDTQPPLAICPSNISTSAPPGQASVVVTFGAAFSDNCPGGNVACVPPSGSSFAVGTTTVTCTATDASGNTGTCAFTVTVTGQPLPCMITCPANQNVNTGAGATQCGATANYPAPTTSGDCGAVTCTPASGSFFPVGTTTVNCSTAAGPSCSFTVTVTDNTLPAITCPGNVSTNIPQGQTSAVVNYPAPTASDNCPGVGAVCSPASGSSFPVGTTTVTCTATDASANVRTCTFTVTVNVVGECSTIPQLIARVQATNLSAGLKNALISKLLAAQAALDRGRTNAAINQLEAFINQVKALKKTGRLDATTADALIACAQTIISHI
jgi:hypothetical protein